jgi:hypothetical protein
MPVVTVQPARCRRGGSGCHQVELAKGRVSYAKTAVLNPADCQGGTCLSCRAIPRRRHHDHAARRRVAPGQPFLTRINLAVPARDRQP